MSAFSPAQRIAAEALGSALLAATVIGSGVMAERLAGGNVALALLANTIATGAILVVAILALSPISGAHLNPAVSLVSAWRGDLERTLVGLYIGAQLAGACAGALMAHVMFELPALQLGSVSRTGTGQWAGEFIATFGLLVTILAVARFQRAATAQAVGLYIVAAYWFTSSTSFANPSVTVARALTNTFAGIAPGHAVQFILAQLAGAAAAALLMRWLISSPSNPVAEGA